MLLWVGVILFGTVEDWFHQPVDKLNTSTSFLEADEIKVNEQFVGNG